MGDIIGSPYEFDGNNYKAKDFELLSEESHFTDDTVMTVAVEQFLPRNFCTILYRFRIAAGLEFDGEEDLRLRIGRDAYEKTGW